MVHWGLFSRHTSVPVDLRDRDFVLAGCPLIAQDDVVVIADVTVRLVVRRPADQQDLVLGYDPVDEPALHAICVMVLRLMAEDMPAEDLLVGRARTTEVVELAYSFAPVGAGVDPRVLSVELRAYDPTLVTLAHEFRVVTS